MTPEEKARTNKLHTQREYEVAQGKKDYQKACGTALLTGELEMVEKWHNFVDEQADNPFICGHYQMNFYK